MVKAKFSLSYSCKGIVKKQSVISIITIDHPFYNKEGKQIPGCEESIGKITLLIELLTFSIFQISF